MQALKKRNVRTESDIFKEDDIQLSEFLIRRTAEPLSRMNTGKSFLNLSSDEWIDNDDNHNGKEWRQHV
ncbi:hypothetical protein TNCT_461571 [Trichonephila clavata]|uniref:Uncharacterized protein n=1 Tax=Trichonephila clavata TaxID=2740835 RepID=A0A8X6HFZ2_TRICU|nr:hypothetical protein TNCT_461571 [Trichonephila clavata]